MKNYLKGEILRIIISLKNFIYYFYKISKIPTDNGLSNDPHIKSGEEFHIYC